MQVGAFTILVYALSMCEELEANGYSVYIVSADSYFKVHAGVFANRSNAEYLAPQLRKKGCPVFITAKANITNF